MEHLTMTPFGRPVTAGLLAHQQLAEAPLTTPGRKKWDLFHTLCAARTAFGLTDRDMTVMNALLTFYPGDTLEDGPGLVVFPSNATLSQRAHGMAESTLRRHLAALVKAGVILRHDSPNGKRYAARGQGGEVLRAFGFNLRPLLVRAAELQKAADRLTAAQAAYKRDREACVLMLRDASQLLAYAIESGAEADWPALEARSADARRALRRKLTAEELARTAVMIKALLAEVRTVIEPSKTEKMSGKPDQNERHYQNSKPDTLESEPCLETAKGGGGSSKTKAGNIPLSVVLKACTELQTYCPDRLRHWHDLVAAADMLKGMMGISSDAWQDACAAMGPENAATVVACILQRMDAINSPGGYLRSLTSKAIDGKFSPGPMVMALLNTGNRVAA